MGRFDPSRGSLESWLIMLSRNRIRSANAALSKPLEREKSWSGLEADLEAMFPDLRQDAFPSAVLENSELGAVITSVMAGLSPDYRHLLEAKYVRGETVRDMAVAAGRTEKALESQLTRARGAFREAFREVAGGILMDMGLQ